MLVLTLLLFFLVVLIGMSQPALRLLISIFAGYPIASFYQSHVLEKPSKLLHHAYFALCGLAICYFNFGSDTCHSLIAVSATYLMLQTLSARPNVLITASFVFHMGHLMIGYSQTSTIRYDITWTMPHCVLVLRLIGLAFGVVDGQKQVTSLRFDQREYALSQPPTLCELLAFAYFPMTVLVGPQFSLNRYRRFIEGEFHPYVGAARAGMQRLCVGVFYLIVYVIGKYFIPSDYLLSRAFREENFPIRLILLGTWGKVILAKYVSIWLLVEGAMINLGITYNGRLPNGEPDWSGCANVKVFEYETGLTMQHYIDSFNMSTSRWVAGNVFKRLKFLDKRALSHFAALIFLAAWHGLHSGYYMTFLLEFLIIIAERQMAKYYNQVLAPKYEHYLGDSSTVLEYLRFIVVKSYDLILMGWCLVPFVFLTTDKWLRVYGTLNHFGFIFLSAWFTFYHFQNPNRRMNS